MPSKVYDPTKYQERRAWMFQYLGNSCSTCGTSHDLFITYKDETNARFKVSRNWSVSLDRLKAELKKCRLMCRTHYFKQLGESRRRPTTGQRKIVDNKFDLQDTEEL